MSYYQPNAPDSRVASLAQALLARHGVQTPLTLDVDLRAAGLTSLDLVNLTLAVEAEFDVFIPADMMTPEHFRSVASIAALVTKLEPA